MASKNNAVACKIFLVKDHACDTKELFHVKKNKERTWANLVEGHLEEEEKMNKSAG